jgi:3-hydroxyisobutyrate dehydrogenase
VMVGGFEAIAPMVGPLLRKDVTIFDGLTAEQSVDVGSLVTVAEEALSRFGQPRKP